MMSVKSLIGKKMPIRRILSEAIEDYVGKKVNYEGFDRWDIDYNFFEDEFLWKDIYIAEDGGFCVNVLYGNKTNKIYDISKQFI